MSHREQTIPLNQNGDISYRQSSHETISLDMPDSDPFSSIPHHGVTMPPFPPFGAPGYPSSRIRNLEAPPVGQFAPTSFATMPNDILVHIFSFLPLPSLFVCAAVCKRWKTIVDNEENYTFLDLSPYTRKLLSKDYERIITHGRFRQITHLSISGAFDFPPELLLTLSDYFPRLVSLDVSHTRGLAPYLPEAAARLHYLRAIETHTCDGKVMANVNPTNLTIDAITMLRGFRDELQTGGHTGDVFDIAVVNNNNHDNNPYDPRSEDEKDDADKKDFDDEHSSLPHDDSNDDLSPLTVPLNKDNRPSLYSAYRNTPPIFPSSSSSSVTSTDVTPPIPNNAVAPASAGVLLSLYKAHRDSTAFANYCTADQGGREDDNPENFFGNRGSVLLQQWKELDRTQPFTSVCTLAAWRQSPMQSLLQADPDSEFFRNSGIRIPKFMSMAKSDAGCFGGVGWYEYCALVGRNPHAGMNYRDPDNDTVWETPEPGIPPAPASENPPQNPEEEQDLFLREEDNVFSRLPPPTRVHPATCSYRDRNSSRVPCRGHVRGVLVWGTVGNDGLISAREQAVQRMKIGHAHMQSIGSGNRLTENALPRRNATARSNITTGAADVDIQLDTEEIQSPRSLGGAWRPLPDCSLRHFCACHNPENPPNSRTQGKFRPPALSPLCYVPIAIAFVCVSHRPELSSDPRLRQCPSCQRYISAADQDANEAACAECRYQFVSKKKWFDFDAPLSQAAKDNLMSILAQASALPPTSGLPIWMHYLPVTATRQAASTDADKMNNDEVRTAVLVVVNPVNTLVKMPQKSHAITGPGGSVFAVM